MGDAIFEHIDILHYGTTCRQWGHAFVKSVTEPTEHADATSFVFVVCGETVTVMRWWVFGMGK